MEQALPKTSNCYLWRVISKCSILTSNALFSLVSKFKLQLHLDLATPLPLLPHPHTFTSLRSTWPPRPFSSPLLSSSPSSSLSQWLETFKSSLLQVRKELLRGISTFLSLGGKIYLKGLIYTTGELSSICCLFFQGSLFILSFIFLSTFICRLFSFHIKPKLLAWLCFKI